MDTLQAAILAVKLRYLEQWNAERREAAGQYRSALSTLEVILPQERQGAAHVYHVFVIRARQRDELRKFLQERGIETGLHYPLPLHLQPAYRHLGYREGDFPEAERLAREVLSLPMFPGITPAEIREVGECVRAFGSYPSFRVGV
jgi:dTDP-4-amino-4,6-dideoxygalactose transaminase